MSNITSYGYTEYPHTTKVNAVYPAAPEKLIPEVEFGPMPVGNTVASQQPGFDLPGLPVISMGADADASSAQLGRIGS